MLGLLEFLYRRRIFGFFLLLEGISIWLIISYSNRYNTYFFNTSNVVIGGVTERFNSISDYFGLQEVNQKLAEENLRLRRSLAFSGMRADSFANQDSASYDLVLAKVVNSTHLKSRNFLTLKISASDSIQPGMGVVSSDGVVGRVKSVSNRYATVVSVLNPNLMISSRVKSNNALCTVQWDGSDALYADLKFVPRHLGLAVGDTVITSGYNAVFPEGFTIGIVSSNDLRLEDPFYDARLKLATDFSTIRYAYILKVRDKPEILNLEEGVYDE